MKCIFEIQNCINTGYVLATDKFTESQYIIFIFNVSQDVINFIIQNALIIKNKFLVTKEEEGS
ncbi:MAG TPA: hypothetical protein VMS35_01145 [Nitrososphaeraceae archaeon]|nr:hypothetical protein [Nitrososphaeraceae archaeon]